MSIKYNAANKSTMGVVFFRSILTIDCLGQDVRFDDFDQDEKRIR